jgi:hypothetical protein
VGRRVALLAWAEKHNAAIVEETDYDCEFRFGGRPSNRCRCRPIGAGHLCRIVLENDVPTLRLGFVVRHRCDAWSSQGTCRTGSPMISRRRAPSSMPRALERRSGECGQRLSRSACIITSTLSRDFSDPRLISSSAGLHIAAVARTASPKQISGIVRRVPGWNRGPPLARRRSIDGHKRGCCSAAAPSRHRGSGGCVGFVHALTARSRPRVDPAR